MIDGKMQDDATWKQAKVIVDLARVVAQKDPAMAAAYDCDATARKGFDPTARLFYNSAMQPRKAKYRIGQVVKHRVYPFRGVIFDVDPVFDNTEEWYQSIPEEIRPSKEQPFYHLFAENARRSMSPMFPSRTCCRTIPANRGATRR